MGTYVTILIFRKHSKKRVFYLVVVKKTFQAVFYTYTYLCFFIMSIFFNSIPLNLYLYTLKCLPMYVLLINEQMSAAAKKPLH